MKEVIFPVHSTSLGQKSCSVTFPDECVCCGAQATQTLPTTSELSYYEMPYRKTLRFIWSPRYCPEHAKAIEDNKRPWWKSWLGFNSEEETLKSRGFVARGGVITLYFFALPMKQISIVCNRDEFAEKLHWLNSHSRIVDLSVAGQQKEFKYKCRRWSAWMRIVSLPAFLGCSALGLLLGLITISAGRFTQWAAVGAILGAILGATLFLLSLLYSYLGRER